MSDLIERAERVAGLSTGEHERLIRELVEALRAGKGESMSDVVHEVMAEAGSRIDADDYTLRGSASEFVAALQEAIAQIPEAYRHTAELTWRCDEDGVSVQVCYHRPETPCERERREKRDSIIEKERRDYELAELARLRAKYGDACLDP